MTIIRIKQEPIELFKLLKLANVAGCGSDAKAMIAKGIVTLNGSLETQKRKKVFAGDTIKVENITVTVELGED
jgi:ribosome-associated protein